MNRLALLLTWMALPLSLAAGEFVAKDGTRIAYTEQGAGERSPVLLIHGLSASGALNWTLPGITTALAKEHRVIVMDCRGHGKSDKPEHAGAFGVKMVEDVVALLDHLGIRSAHLAGYSMGGLIAMKTAVVHPQRVRSLLLCGMGWLEEGKAQQRVWARAKNPCARGFTELAVTAEEVKALKIPAAVIVGDRDPVDRSYVVPLERLRLDWPVTRIEGAGHLNCVVKPEFREAVLRALAEFAGR